MRERIKAVALGIALFTLAWLDARSEEKRRRRQR